MKFKEKVKVQYKIFVQRVKNIIEKEKSPYRVAMGFFIGTIVGWTPTVGIQMIIAGSLAFIFRASKLPAILMVWISNPVTMVPMYWFEYITGRWFMQSVGIKYVWWNLEMFKNLFARIGEHTFFDAFLEFVHAGIELVVPMFVGGIFIGVINGLIIALPIYFYMKKRKNSPRSG